MRTLGVPSESAALRQLAQRVYNLERQRGEPRVARTGDKMTGRLVGPTGLDPISSNEYARKAYVDRHVPLALVDAKGDLLAGTGPDQLARLPVGPNRRVLIADDSTATGLRWDWLKVGGPSANRIELHDHADPSDPDVDDGFIHFHAPGQSFHGNLNQDFTGTPGTTRQARINLYPSQMGGADTPHLHIRSRSEDGTQPDDAHLAASMVHIEGDTEVKITSFAPVRGPAGRNPVDPDDLVRKGYLGTHDVGGGVPVGGIILWTAATLPSPYLYCQGQAVSRTTYAALFAIIGTTYGVGDGSTTFNLPNLNDRIPQGVGALGLGGIADKGSHFHNTQTSTDLNTGAFDGFSSSTGGWTHSHGANQTVQDGAFHEHSFGVGVNTLDQTNKHTHNYGYGTAGVLATDPENENHRHSLQGIITTSANVHHTHGINNTTVSDHNHAIGHAHNVGTHNHGSTLSGGVSLTAFGLYFAIRAL